VRVRLAGKGVRIAAFAAIPLVLILTYVWLTAQVTAQTYRLHDDQARQAEMLQRDNELRQQVARLESLPRLEAAAAKLHMTVPPGVAIIAPPPSRIAVHPTALAATIEDFERWLNVR
jgi:hypothetical protein